MMTRAKITTRIQALISKAQGTDNEHEAAAFMAKAQELLEEYQIDIGELADADDPVKVFEDGLERTQKDPTWHRKLYAALAMYYGCKVVFAPAIVRGQWGSRVELTGRESSVTTARLMYPWVKGQCETAGRRLVKDHPEYSASQHARRVANALVYRIWSLTGQEKAQPRTEAVAKNALVTLDRVQQVFDGHYGNSLKSGRAGSGKTSAAARQAAQGISLNRQAGSSNTLQLR